QHLDDACLGSISEVFSAEPPFQPGGAPAQAWGVAELMHLSPVVLPATPPRAHALDPTVRRALMGATMGLTAIALIHSPWGKRSGAHLNPAVTLAFWRLGRVPGRVAIFYGVGQAAGGAIGGAFTVLV